MNPQELQQLRAQSGDNATFNTLMQNDAEFKTKVERVQKAYPNMTPFEKTKFPSAMIDIHLGKTQAAPSGAGEMNAQTINRGMTEEMRPKGAWDTLAQDPLVFAGQTAKNVIPSTARLIGGVAGMIAHPIETGKTIGKLGLGGVANTIETIADMAGVKNAEDIFNFESEEVASAVGDFYVQRYGGLEQAATTLRDDPAGFLSDLGAVVTGIGGAIKGGATAVGSVTGTATKGATALTELGRGVRAAQAVGSSMIKTGINMEPLVITGRGVVLAGKATGIGKILDAERQMSTALRIHPSLTREFMEPTKSAGKTPARYAIEKGVTGSTVEEIADKFERIATKSKDAVDNGLAKFQQTYDVTDFAGANDIRVHDILMEILKKYEANPVGNEDVISHVKSLLKQERMNLSEINGVKRMASDAFNLFGGAENVAGKQGIENLYYNVQKFIEDQAALKGFDDIGILNKDTQLSTFMQKALEKSATSRYGNNVLSLTNSILATGGGTVGTMLGGGAAGLFAAAGILVARKILGSVRFKTAFAKYVSRITPWQRAALEKAVQTGKHTKESRIILRRVTARTAEDIKNQRIGEMEAIAAPRTAGQLSESRLLSSEATSPSTIQEGMSPVNIGEQRLAGLKGGEGTKVYFHGNAKLKENFDVLSPDKSGFGGTSFADNIEIAKPFANDVPNSKGKVYSIDSSKLKILDVGTEKGLPSLEKIIGKDGYIAENDFITPSGRKKLQDMGYDAVRFDNIEAGNMKGKEIRVVRPIKKSELNIVEESNTSPSPTPAIPKELEGLAVEARKFAEQNKGKHPSSVITKWQRGLQSKDVYKIKGFTRLLSDFYRLATK